MLSENCADVMWSRRSFHVDAGNWVQSVTFRDHHHSLANYQITLHGDIGKCV